MIFRKPNLALAGLISALILSACGGGGVDEGQPVTSQKSAPVNSKAEDAPIPADSEKLAVSGRATVTVAGRPAGVSVNTGEIGNIGNPGGGVPAPAPGSNGETIQLEGVYEFSAQQSADFSKPGKITKHTFNAGPLESLGYLVYTPTTYDPQKGAPLLLAVHGCGTTAQQFMASSALHPTAEREGFVVIYPDVPLKNEGIKCWQWFDPQDQFRGSGDPSLLAGMTREVMSRMKIDSERVYVLGMSSGAMMTSILGATYPDLFAAIGENAGCAYMAGFQCLLIGATMPDELIGQLAFKAMGEYARVMPVVQIRGDLDGVRISNSTQVINQWTVTNNLVMSGTTTGPFDNKSDTLIKGKKRDGYEWTVNRYKDNNGCLLIEDWTVHQMEHAFSGGSPDPELATFTDPKGPMFAEIAWNFFKRYKLSDFKNGYKPTSKACVLK